MAQKLSRYLVGWREYFRLTEMPATLRELDGWIRHRMRCLQLKQWKRATTVFRELRARGASVALAKLVAARTRRWWHISAKLINAILTNQFFDGLGVPRLAS